MATTFQPDIVLPNDPAGFSFWLNSHNYEHLRFTLAIQAVTPSFTSPDYDFAAFRSEQAFLTDWLSAHQLAHEALRAYTGVTGYDLSVIDFHDKVSWFEWMDAHALEHGFLRQALGAV